MEVICYTDVDSVFPYPIELSRSENDPLKMGPNCDNFGVRIKRHGALKED